MSARRQSKKARHQSPNSAHGPGSIPTTIVLLILVPLLYCVGELVGREKDDKREITVVEVTVAEDQPQTVITRHVSSIQLEIRSWMIARTARRSLQ
jgi:hypothetical protein